MFFSADMGYVQKLKDSGFVVSNPKPYAYGRIGLFAMKNKGINVTGPCPPDTVFLQAVEGKYDIVVAMYHDQGHIPLKLLGFNSGVNVTVGLPFVRTSVDHGTAFEIAWQGKANENSMVEAVKLAVRLAK